MTRKRLSMAGGSWFVILSETKDLIVAGMQNRGFLAELALRVAIRFFAEFILSGIEGFRMTREGVTIIARNPCTLTVPLQQVIGRGGILVWQKR